MIFYLFLFLLQIISERILERNAFIGAERWSKTKQIQQRVLEECIRLNMQHWVTFWLYYNWRFNAGLWSSSDFFSSYVKMDLCKSV